MEHETNTQAIGPTVQGVKPMAAVRVGMSTLLRQSLALFGLFLIIIGVPIAILTPFPFVPIGLPIVIVGVVLLGRFSVWGKMWMERVLKRFPSIERFAPNWLMQLVFGRAQDVSQTQAQTTQA